MRVFQQLRPILQSTFPINVQCSGTLRKSIRAASILRNPEDISSSLSQPRWSVHSTLFSPEDAPTEKIPVSKLHHLLRLSALPLPATEAEEDKLLSDLHRLLRFVRAMQAIDTTGVKPLVVIRDETIEASEEREVGLEDPEIQRAMNREKRIGKRGRVVSVEAEGGGRVEEVEGQWDPLQQAGRKVGKYIAVDTAKD